MARVYREGDIGDEITTRKVAILGYGSQGHAHALNLKESGCDVTVGLYEGSKSWPKAEDDGLPVKTIADAVKDADVVMMLLPDERQPAVFQGRDDGRVAERRLGRAVQQDGCPHSFRVVSQVEPRHGHAFVLERHQEPVQGQHPAGEADLDGVQGDSGCRLRHRLLRSSR